MFLFFSLSKNARKVVKTRSDKSKTTNFHGIRQAWMALKCTVMKLERYLPLFTLAANFHFATVGFLLSLFTLVVLGTAQRSNENVPSILGYIKMCALFTHSLTFERWNVVLSSSLINERVNGIGRSVFKIHLRVHCFVLANSQRQWKSA